MKNIHFQMLDFEGMIPEIDEFQDLGYVLNLLETTKKVFKKFGKINEEDYISRWINLNFLKHNNGGLHVRTTNELTGSKTSVIYYNPSVNESSDIHCRAHEETHAVCHLGLRKDLERRIGDPKLGNLHDEDFCDQAGLYVLKRKGIEPHPDLLIPYFDRNLYADRFESA